MNILVYWEQYSWGGTDTHLLNWATGNEKLFGGQDKLIILTNDQNPGFFRIKNELDLLKSVDYFHFPLFSFFSYRERLRAEIKHRSVQRAFLILGFLILPVFFFIQFFQQHAQIKKIIRKHGAIHIAVSNNGAYPGAWGNLIFILAAKATKCAKVVMLVHHHASAASGIRKILSRVIDTIGLIMPDKVIAVSEATKNSIIEKRNFANSKKIEVIFNGLDFDAFNPGRANAETNFYRLFDIPAHKKLIGILGVQEEYKGHDDVIKALGMLKKKKGSLDLCLLVIGKEDQVEKERLMKDVIENNVEDSVVFTGYLKDSSYDIIKALDLLVVATKDFEGFGLTLGEAMAVRTPVLATAVGAIPEFVFHGKNGYLVQPNHPDQIAEALVDFLDHPADWQKRTQVGAETIKIYSLENMARNFHQSFQSELLFNEK